MIASLVLVPILDALAPADPDAASRRIRYTAIWMAIAAWLLPDYPGLGTDSVVHRSIICGAFVASAVTAHFRTRYRWARVGLDVAALAAGVLVWLFSHGSIWGLAFTVFCGVVVGLTMARNRWIRIAPAPPEPDPMPPIPRAATTVIHALAWIGISVCFMTQWAGQAMVVPTGSMQPTIMGARPPAASGDHLFVDNFSYLFRDPRRWEIVVFEFPLFRERYFVKRVVGLPGEHVEIKDGDIWVDGSVATKPRVVQHTLWRELFPRSYPGATPKAINVGFQGNDSEWKKVSGTEVRCKPGAKPTFASYGASLESRDLRIAFTAVPEAGAVVIAQVTSRGVPVRFQFGVDEESSDGLSVGETKEPVRGLGVHAGTAVRVELCVADGVAWATLDGREVASAAVPTDGKGKNRAEIGAATAPVSFRDVVVARDIVYTTGGGPAAYDVPKDGFFFIGDNVEGSMDSRKWFVEMIHPPGGAAALEARKSLITEMGEDSTSANVRVADGKYRFVDVDGVAREVPVAGTKVDHDVRRPFATRGHLVGRAVLVFWPWTRAEAGFLPRLLP